MKKASSRKGWLIEEYVTASAHFFNNDGYSFSENDPDCGSYTGVFWFEYPDGTVTKRYTKKTAPKWLLELYEEATMVGQK
jgi:hypothetical protein